MMLFPLMIEAAILAKSIIKVLLTNWATLSIVATRTKNFVYVVVFSRLLITYSKQLTTLLLKIPLGFSDSNRKKAVD